MAAENPYLAHLPPQSSFKKERVQLNGSSSSSPSTSTSGSALDGFIPRKVGAAQTIKAMENDRNPFNGKPYSQGYKDILKKRNNLPVFQQMGKLLEVCFYIRMGLGS